MTDQAGGIVVTSSKLTAAKKSFRVAKPKPAAVKTVGSLKKKSAGVSKDTKGRSAMHHPKYIDMVVKAIKELKDRNGSSSQAIIKHIRGHFNLGPAGVSKTAFRNAMKNGLAKKVLKNNGKGMSGKFKLSTDAAAKPKSKTTHVVSKVTSGSPSKVAKVGKPKAVKSVKKVPTASGKKSPVKKLTKRPATKAAQPKVTKKVGVTKKKMPVTKLTPSKKVVPKVVKT